MTRCAVDGNPLRAHLLLPTNRYKGAAQVGLLSPTGRCPLIEATCSQSDRLRAVACLCSALLLASACSSADDGDGVPAPPPVYPAEALSSETPEEGIAQLNEYRALAGLDPVSVDTGAMSEGCANHIDYLIWENENNGKPICFLSHTEDNHDNPFYSPENEQAGKDSVIACGFSTEGKQSMGQAVDLWINSLYHRLPLLHNGLHTVGYASKDGYNCINYRSGTTAKLIDPVLWPPDGTVDVPTSFAGHEAPCPTLSSPLSSNGMNCPGSGFIVTASWFGYGTDHLTTFRNSDPSARLVNEATNAEVPLMWWWADRVPGHDPAPRYMKDTLTLVPAEPLPPDTTFRVEFEGSISEEPTSLQWRFTTGTREL